MGLSAVVLTTQPSFPTYPEPLSAAAVGAGLPAPSAAAALLGKGGAALMLILLFLAVTSALSAELVAVSSLFTCEFGLFCFGEEDDRRRWLRSTRYKHAGDYVTDPPSPTDDIYVPYINPRASEKQILAVDHVAIILWGLCSGVLGVVFFYAGISMGWLYEFMGVVLGGAVCPIALAIMSSKANKWGCICGA